MRKHKRVIAITMFFCSVLFTAWCEMNINGNIYVFDPQVEANIANGGSIKYHRFGKTYDQVQGKYIKEE
ncbi:MAG: hypothetical protein IIW92_08475 [Lachnospiraceae bacterium]|nr:hypothetical protein [Lachnospiraceae bacterium]